MMSFKGYSPLKYFLFTTSLLGLIFGAKASTNSPLPTSSELENAPKPVQIAHLQLILPDLTATEIELYQATLEGYSLKKP